MPLHPVCDIRIVLDPSGIHVIDHIWNILPQKTNKWWQMFHFGWTIPLVQEAANDKCSWKWSYFLKWSYSCSYVCFFPCWFWSSGPVHLSWILTPEIVSKKRECEAFFGAIKASLRAPFLQEAPFHRCYFSSLVLFLGATLIPHNTPEIEALKNERILTGSNFSIADEK